MVLVVSWGLIFSFVVLMFSDVFLWLMVVLRGSSWGVMVFIIS